MRPEAAAAVVGAGGRLTRLSVEEPSLEVIYRRYFEKPGGAPCGVKDRPGRGSGVVFLKELSDHLTSARMLVLQLLVVLTAFVALYGGDPAAQARRTAEDPFLFLRLFTVTSERFRCRRSSSFLGFLVPLMAIGLGFDAVNGEHNRRTLSRILAQPIYRDALLFGKFLAGLATLAISLLALWLLVIGLGLLRARPAAGRRGDGARASCSCW